jgi:hypothetical protein
MGQLKSLSILASFSLAVSAWAAQTVPGKPSPSNPFVNPVPPAVEVGPEAKPLFGQYRIFIEAVTFSASDPGYKDADYTFKPQLRADEAWSEPRPILMGPSFKAKDLPLKKRQQISYGLTYYFPAQVSDPKQGRIEGEIALNSYASGILPTRKYTESFKVSLDRLALGRSIDAKGDRGSVLRLRLMSVCDFNIYETMDLASIRKSLRTDLEALGGRVFDERGDRSLFSRPTNAVWIGAKAPEECVQMAMRTFSLKYGIPLKGVFAMGEGHQHKWFFNPYGVTLGYSREIESKPELSRAYITELTRPGAKARALQ